MFRLLAGVRHEKSYQNVQTFDLFDKTAAPILSELESDDYFPVVTGTMVLDQWDMQLRASYSETISRPDFRELSPAPFTHPVTGFIIVGNPDLDVTYIKNYDARWEWYFSSDESISVGLFYKQFDAPIESIIKPSDALERSFINAQDATVQGIEFDTYKWLGFVNEKFENFFISANLTLLKSEVNIRPQDSGIITNPTRALQGQADYISNLQLGYDDGFTQKGSFVYHVTGPKIREVGVLKAPDVIDEAYGELDFAYTRYMGDHMELSVKVKNMLNKLQATTQGGYDVNSYREGRSASLGLTYNF
jgi:TonB-dependent receptor